MNWNWSRFLLTFSCNTSHVNEMLRSPTRLRYDDEDDEVGHCGAERSCNILSPDARRQDTRSSFFVHSSNGRTNNKYLSSEKTGDGIAQMTAANETCIWFSAYFNGSIERNTVAQESVKNTHVVLELIKSYRVTFAYRMKLTGGQINGERILFHTKGRLF